ncbi:addiction module antidote protein, HigA family (plasmid) [Methylocapsa polymorpha]|uniref:Addiction module antidote protein, HigA family n=1 Tax=Methylocapsa polymorpha TaxID=3080828 RepID=A0ABZ0I0T7_9HYPH|nr:helix-turn-helix domain-containing protein [Methylocapsa sp. RX1]WOJ91756.1 addiction module antidote protein, HigA family [Methylocapsa sp. RX1]
MLKEQNEIRIGPADMKAIPHPGVELRQMLEDRGWSQTDLVFVLGCHPKSVNQIINEKQGVSPAMSKALGEAFGLAPGHFSELQRAFDLASADEPDPSVLLRAQMQKNYPIREMVKRGWIQDGDADSLGKQLARFFDVRDAANVPYLAHSAKKTSYEERAIPPVQLAWLFRVKQIARAIAVPKYSERRLLDAVSKLREMLAAPEEARHVPKILGECGVRFVVVESLPSSKIDGVCFWLDENSPVIGMSLRFDRIDNFWFVLRHEIEHALQGHGRGDPEGMIDAELQGDQAGTGSSVPEEERIANAAASDFCVPRQKMDSFIARKNPFFYEKDVLAFAKLNNLHPALPVGQIQHATGRFDYLKKYQVKIRQFVLPGTIADGWGQSPALAMEI